MVGFSLSANQQNLRANSDGSISLGSATSLPNCIWVSQTDGLGMSQIITVVQPDATQPPVAVLLSLMSDNSVSFQPALPPPPTTPVPPPIGSPTVVTQTWLSAPVGNATLTSTGGFLASIPLTFQPVLPDTNGNYAPSQASGWLVQTSQGAGFSQSSGTTFTLTMSGMAPNYMRMVNMPFLLNSTPSAQQTYGPAFGVYPSTPMTYALTGELPPFLIFSTQTGAFTPNGTSASATYQSNDSISATNACGTASAPFQITVSDPTSAPAIAVAKAGSA